MRAAWEKSSIACKDATSRSRTRIRVYGIDFDLSKGASFRKANVTRSRGTLMVPHGTVVRYDLNQ